MIAAKTPWRQQMPDFLQFVDGTLNHRVKLFKETLGYNLYFIDFSEWKLRFSDRTPVIWVTEGDLAAMEPRELAQSLVEVVRSQSLVERNPIIMLQGPGAELAAQLKPLFMPILLLDQADQQAVRESRRPSGELLDRLAAQLDLSLLTPYETSKPVTGSRFFGREFEIRRILQTGDTNFAIMGIRRIGKTSLMREKLAKELGRVATGRTVYILDEPTTGLHFADIQRLLDVLHRLTDAGNTVIVVEHNLDVIKTADWLVDLGPEGGEKGGWIVAEGTPEQVAAVDASYTGRFLREMV